MEIGSISERDARGLTRKIVERLRALGGNPTRFGVALTNEGLFFTVQLGAKQVTVQALEGTLSYEAVAREMLIRANDPAGDWGDRIYQVGPAETPLVTLH